MKTKWKALTLLLAAMLLFTACEERRTVDISDGGDMSAVTGAAEKQPAEQEAPAAEEQQPEAEPAEESGTKDAPAGAVTLVSMSLEPGGSGMCLVPLEPGGVFVINNVLSQSCTITSDAKDFLIADCTVQAETAMDADLEFILLQSDAEILTARMTAALNEGENTIQVLIRLGSPVSGEYLGRLFANGELIGTESTGGETESA